jgi:CheY-like chemotaxis protein
MTWRPLTPGPDLFRPASKLRVRRKRASVCPVTQILVIEDDGATRDLISQVLRDEGYELTVVARLEAVIAEAVPELIITDLVGLDRYERGRAGASVRRVQDRYPATPIVVCTAYEQAAKESDRLGAAAVVRKPFTIEALVKTVARLLAH